MKIRCGFGVRCLLAIALAVASGSAAQAQSFGDDFSSDSTGSYALTLIDPGRGTATFVYDAAGQRAQIRNGDNFGLRAARAVPSRYSGTLLVDLLPTVKYPSGGILTLWLIQDADNYYVVTNTSGKYAPGTLSKVVGGQVVETTSFGSGYLQNVGTTVRFDFAPDAASVLAFGQTLALSQDTTPLEITQFQIEAYQQDVYVDNIVYGGDAVTNQAPIADAGFDQAATGGDLVQLDASASVDPGGEVVSYFWNQLSGPAVTLSDPASATPSFVAPDPGSGTTTLVFQVTVEDALGVADSDSVFVDVWSPSALAFSDDFSSNSTGSYTLTLIDPDRGTGTLVYDAAGQRAQLRNGDNFGLRAARELPPRSSGRFSVNLLPTVKHPGTARFGVRLVQDANNYYALTNYSPASTPDTFVKVVNGVVVETATFAAPYVQNTPVDVTIDFAPGVVVATAFGQVIPLEQNATALTLRSFEIEAYQQDLYFDDVDWSEFVEHLPSVVLTAPLAGQFQSDSTLRVAASSLLLEPDWRVVFAIDAGLPGEIVVEDDSAPYAVDVADVPAGTHSVDVYVVDANGSQVIGDGLHDQVSGVAIGDYYVGIGDSITKGTGDKILTDNVSADGRNSGGGYEPILNDRLTALTGYPQTVVNEGVGGKTASWGANKTGGILNGHPEALIALILFGTNDSLPSIARPSGAGLLPGDSGYSGSYKAYMQTIVDVVVASGRTPVLMKVPFTYGDCGRCAYYPDPQNAPRNVLIREYNQAIDELVVENALPIAGPDLYTHFEQHPEQMADRHHPNGVGYQAIAEMLADVLLAP